MPATTMPWPDAWLGRILLLKKHDEAPRGGHEDPVTQWQKEIELLWAGLQGPAPAAKLNIDGFKAHRAARDLDDMQPLVHRAVHRRDADHHCPYRLSLTASALP